MMVASVILMVCIITLGTSVTPLQSSSPGSSGGVRFFYYPSPNDRREIILGNVNSLQSSGLRDGVSTVVLVDGFLSTGDGEMSQKLKNAFIGQGSNRNIIVVDWGALSGSERSSVASGQNVIELMLLYVKVLGNTGTVASQISEFLNFIRIYKNVQFNQVYLCGHSLGAHVAGKAGNLVKMQFGTLVSRISGLDPAGPFFSLPLTRHNKLNHQDASFVDIYHTNQGSLGDSERNTGHINVFINGGSIQPGCGRQANGRPANYCSHSYSWKVFSTSFFQGRLFACPCSGMRCKCRGCHLGCPNPSIVGVAASNRLRGEFYVSSVDAF